MKIRTNYQSHDWYRLIITLFIYVVIGGGGIFFLVNNGILPIIQGVGFVAKFLNEVVNDEWNEYVKEWSKSNRSKLEANNIMISVLVVSLALPVILCFGFAILIIKITLLPLWIAKKLNLNPKMDLVVIKNEKFWFKIRF